MKKVLSFLLALVMIGALWLPVTAQGEQEDVSGDLTIWSWGAGREKEARERAVQIFIEKYPELNVQHVVYPTADSVWDQKQAAAYAAGTAGDVMQMSPDYYGLMSAHYEDLMPYVERDGIDLEEVMTPGIMDGYVLPDGRLEALPLLANCFLFAYNKDMFDELGVEYPTDDWTWDDFAEMAPQFVSGEGFEQQFFMARHWVLSNFGIIAKGGRPYDEDFNQAEIGTPEVHDSLEIFHQLAEEKAIPDDAASQSMPAEQMFVSGKCAIYPMGGFEIESVGEAIGDTFEWDAVLPPKTAPDGYNTNITYATGYAMNVASENKDAAWLFMKEMSFQNDDMARETMYIGLPANKNIALNEYVDLTFGPVSTKRYLEGLKTSTLNPWGGALATAGDPYGLLWEAVTLAGQSVDEAMDEYVPLIDQAFSELDIQFKK